MNLISFSGIDGAGKSTQIDCLRNHLKVLALRSRVYSFWDDVVALAALRENASRRVFKGEQGIGSPAHPIRRRDKNIAAWYVTAFRFVLYLFDALSLRALVYRLRTTNSVVIFDRYIYDELANLPLERTLVRLYVRALLQFVPKPDIAFVLDADPDAAIVRKPEYPLAFVRRNREAYLTLSRIAGMTVVPALSQQRVAEKILECVLKKRMQNEASISDCQFPHPAMLQARTSHR